MDPRDSEPKPSAVSDDDADAGPPTRQWRDRFRKRDVAVVVSIVTLAVVLHQSYELRRSNELATESMQLERRAWVTIRDARVLEPLTAGQRFVVVGFGVTNTGATPALMVRQTELSPNATEPCTDEHVHAAIDSADESVLGPNSVFTYPTKVELSEDQFKAVQAGSSLYITGGLEYEDIFGRVTCPPRLYHLL